MARYVAKVPTSRSAADAFAYMADARHFEEWDPGVTGVTLVSGQPGTVGATFDVDVKNGGRTMRLQYVTVEVDEPRRLLLKAETSRLRSIDEVRIESSDGGVVVVYDARLELKGVLGVFDLLLRPFFRRIGDRAAAGLREQLGGGAPSADR